MRSTMMKFPLTLDHLLERGGRLFPGAEIVSRMPDRSLHRHTYSDFHRRACALGSALRGLGLKRGERVATLMWNHYAHLEAYFGVPCAGGVVHTLNLRLAPDDIAYIARHAGDRFLIVDDVLLPLLEKFRARAGFEKVIVVPLTGEQVGSGLEDYEKLISKTRPLRIPPLKEDDPAGMCYTSGTTGQPKGVVYSHRALVLHAFAAALPDVMGLSNADSACPVVPMFHVNAWGMPFAGIMAGAKLVFPGPHLDAVSLLDLYQSEGVTLTAGVPTISMSILQALEAEPARWRLAAGMRMVVGGAAAPESLIRAFDRFGLRVLHAWGMTETASLGTVSYLKREVKMEGEEAQYALRALQGVPLPLVDVRAMTVQGPAPWDGQSMGELQVRGPWVAAAYHDSEGDTGKWTDDGWLCTGDVATIDPRGYVKITDRIKDLIKSGGEWISSVDLENALVGHPKVAEAAVIAVPHPKWGERPLAVVVLRDGQSTTAEELRAFIAPRFAPYWLPDDVVFVAEIPRTSTGKMLKAALRERFKDFKMRDQ